MVKTLATSCVIQITCGYYHNLALTQSKCRVFSLKISITYVSYVYLQCIHPKCSGDYCHLSNIFLCLIVGVLTQLLQWLKLYAVWLGNQGQIPNHFSLLCSVHGSGPIHLCVGCYFLGFKFAGVQTACIYALNKHKCNCIYKQVSFYGNYHVN